MKIEKLLTLSQFVDEQVKLAIPDTQHFQNVINYNNFLKRTLTKEMFVNPLGSDEPIHIYSDSPSKTESTMYRERYNKWQEAEKKVIFNGWTLCNDFKSDNSSKTSECIYHEKSKTILFIGDLKDWTIHDLTEATNGELTLKNVTI